MPPNKRNRKTFPHRLRSSLLASVAVIGVMTASPAHAFLGSIVKGVTGLLGGGGAGGGGGCADGGGLLDSFVDAGVAAVAGGPIGEAVSSVAKKAVKDGVPEEFLGCPVIESFPGAVEIQAIKSAIEAVIQTKEAIEQTGHQARMRQRAKLSIMSFLRKQAEQFLVMLGQGKVMPWSTKKVDPIYWETYPDEIIFDEPEDLIDLQRHHEQVARDASLESKRLSASLAQDIAELSDRIDELEAERGTCEGQTCVADVTFQINTITAQLQAKTAIMQSTHNRAQEAQADMDREARKLSDAEFERTTRRMDVYGGPQS